jgi:hypothetical protein
VGLLKPLFKIGKSLLWLVWIIRILLFGSFIYIVVAVGFYCAQPKLPNNTIAPFAVIAITTDNLSRHIYYAGDIIDLGSSIQMTKYWQYNGKGYNMKTGEKSLIKSDWGSIQVYRR